MGGVQIPYLPSTFDVGDLIKAYSVGTQLRQHQRQLEETAAERKLQAKRLEQLMKQADLESELHGLKAKGDVISLLESLPKDQQGAAAGQPVNLSAPSYGIDLNIVPRSLEDVTAALLARKKEEAAIEAAKTRAADTVELPPGMAEQFGLPKGTTSIPKEIIAKLEQSVNLPPEMGGGAAPKSAAELIKSVFTEGQANKRTAGSNAATIEAARIRAEAAKQGAAAGVDPGDIDGLAQQVASGQIKATNLPPKTRQTVLAKLSKDGTAIPDQKFFEKIDQFSTAQSLLGSLKESITKFQNAKGIMDSTQALAQVGAERSAFARLVGRSLGEKGVFTDQDKEDFARILSTSMPVLAWAPTWSQDRADRLSKVLDRVRQRTIDDLEKRTGAKYREGGRVSPVSSAPKTAEDFLSKF
jgi:hypothetical protein